MKPITLSFVLLIIASGLAFQKDANAQYAIPHSVFGNGGAVIQDSTYRLASTVGQPVIGEVSDSSHIMAVGFWYLLPPTEPIPAPVISLLNPTHGPMGTSVTITGEHFGASQDSSTVTFNGIEATNITVWSETQIVAVVPASATTGPVVVTVNGQASNNDKSFTEEAVNPSLTYTMTIQSGINVVGLPLDPGQPWTLENLLAKAQCDFMFYYDGSAFQYYGGGPTTTPVQGGVADVMVRNAPTSVEVTYEGVAWENTSQLQAPALNGPVIQTTTLTLQIIGKVFDENDQPVGAGYTVVITNKNKPQYTKTTTTKPDGTYGEGFFDLQNPVAETGDTIEVQVKDVQGTMVGRNQATYQSGTSMTIDVHFPKTKYFKMTFQPGINMISPPLAPATPWTLEDLLAYVPADFMFYYDGNVFQYYGGGPTAVPVQGGVGVVSVRNNADLADVTFEGIAWENTGNLAAPMMHPISLSSSQSTNVFAVVGQVHAPLNVAGVSLRLRNPHTRQMFSANLLEDGTYHFVVFDLFHPDAIKVGDSLEMTVEDSQGIYQRETLALDISRADIQNHRKIVSPLALTRVPQETKLFSNYPNPFNPDTWIPFQLAHASEVTIEIYDGSGRLIRTLELGHIPAGWYLNQQKAAHWDGKNQFGEQVGSISIRLRQTISLPRRNW
ncbi:IPT/TIG domain-containing protein [Candidatus Poribacteria bacterium]|nr:IPT/TIG domain-containing protein [Candidatus Poribacteria bacterium]